MASAAELRALTRLHVREMAARLRAGHFTARELAEAHLALAHAQDRALNAWASFDDERALAAAEAADLRLAGAHAAASAGEKVAPAGLPPLLGIPVALKDLVVTRGRPSTAGSRILEGFVGPYDAHIAERLDEAGAVVLGKTNMDEFAMGSSTEHSAWGPTSNPWDLDRVPGGSSGGSAAAVAAFHAPVAIGTDTGGSIRQPASLTGTVGLRPTYGRVSRYGIVAFASSLDQVGPFGRDVRDAAALLQAVAGHDERDATSAPLPVPDYPAELPDPDDEAAALLRGVRLGLPREYFVKGMEPGVEAAVRSAVRALESAGAEIVDVSLPHTDYGLATYYIIAPAEASANLARYDGIRYGHAVRDGDVLANYLATRGSGFGAEAKRRIMLGTYALSAGYYDAYYVKALKVRTLIKGDFDRAFAGADGQPPVDALVAPTSPTVAFPLGARLADPVAMYLSDACTLPVNVAGLCGLSVPCGLSEGLPVGLQFIGRAFDEGRLFRLGRAYEAITATADWRRLEPTDLPKLDDPATPTPAERTARLVRR
ncbi:MAG: aspartyl/glutamyl-tRNA amidotransferase subunit A [Chloroflexi bacterium GWC2_73_18]|nr:MAG: aspartyl/glutamyl-tRNA amidotransferase subunit A [Chloroflexi bacterium GWC2_73_18]